MDLRGRLSEEVRRLRAARGLTQRELAERIGSSQPRIACLEQGDASTELLIMALLALGATRRPRYAEALPRGPGSTAMATSTDDLTARVERLEHLFEERTMDRPSASDRSEDDSHRFWARIPFGALWNAQQATTQQILDMNRQSRAERG